MYSAGGIPLDTGHATDVQYLLTISERHLICKRYYVLVSSAVNCGLLYPGVIFIYYLFRLKNDTNIAPFIALSVCARAHAHMHRLSDDTAILSGAPLFTSTLGRVCVQSAA